MNNTPSKNVVFRVDASTAIGTGHVMRCITLANELRKHSLVSHFICRAHTGHMQEAIKKNGHEVILMPVITNGPKQTVGTIQDNYAPWLGADLLQDAKETFSLIKKIKSSFLIVDHYAIDAEWERTVKANADIKVMAIDGLCNRKHECDFLLDHTYTKAGQSRWHNYVPEYCKLFIGPQFALLRPEFADVRNEIKYRNIVKRIIITFGGVDLINATTSVLKSLIQLNKPDIMIDVVIGKGNSHASDIQEICFPFKNATLHIQPENIAKIMVNADLAIIAGGTSIYEAACCGCPMILIAVADNQVAQSTIWGNLGLAEYAGYYQDINEEQFLKKVFQLIEDVHLRYNLSISGKSLVDGMGAQRIAHAIFNQLN